MDKPIKGLKNIELYFDGVNSRFPLKICGICGQPIKPGSNRIILTESKVKKGKHSYMNKITSKAILWFHFKCRRRLIKYLDSHKN
jgi:hypothetical protein